MQALFCTKDEEYAFKCGWNAATKAAEEKFTSTNTARDEICPYRDTWTVFDANGSKKMKIPACIKGGQTSPIA